MNYDMGVVQVHFPMSRAHISVYETSGRRWTFGVAGNILYVTCDFGILQETDLWLMHAG